MYKGQSIRSSHILASTEGSKHNCTVNVVYRKLKICWLWDGSEVKVSRPKLSLQEVFRSMFRVVWSPLVPICRDAFLKV